ncbi:MAG: beta-galactosidase [Rikenellaceae bacterium]|nr:beta-galactosidase [Rikenellaceae bacterium]
MKRPILLLSLLLGAAFSVHAQRIETPFNDGWQFRRAIDTISQNVTLPHTWNAEDMQVRAGDFYAGEGIYTKTFMLPEAMRSGKRIFLRFEGVGQVAEVSVNGQFAGRHMGGYSAFVFDITPLLREDRSEANMVVVKADNAARKEVIPVNHSLFGVYGGIYRPVWLVATDSVSVATTDHASSGVYITQRNVTDTAAEARVRVLLDNATLQPADLTLVNTVYDRSGHAVALETKPLRLSPQGVREYISDFRLTNPHLWQGREDPYLYRVETLVQRYGRTVDSIVNPLGLRHVELRAGEGCYLNGKKYPMYGVCRHQDRWGLGSALTNREHDEDLALIMEVGATTVRLAHYQQSDYFYSKCDSLGLLVWAEIPFVNQVTTYEADNAKSQLSELILQSFNHPSIYIWGLHNEVYKPHRYTAALTAELHRLAKRLDPDRYTVSVNGYGHMEHPVNLNAEVQGMNRYFGWYEGRIGDMQRWVDGLAAKYPETILMLSEYGAEANTAHQTELIGDTYNYNSQFYPETYATKTHEIHWGIISRSPYIVASYLWNMFDFAVPMWDRGGVPARNMKGLVTFDRKLKKDVFYWYKANWSKEPVLYLAQRRLTERERGVTSVTVYSNVGEPSVRLNGRKLTLRQGTTAVHFVADSVWLKRGRNIVTATAKDGAGNVLTDRIEWLYASDKAGAAQEFEMKKEHGGF